MFLAPLALLGAALLALPIIIHTLARRRAKRLDFPSLEFLRDTPLFRLSPRRLKQPLLLALRLLALICLIVGFARPYFSVLGTKTKKRVILIDASASMGASNRKVAALDKARSIIRSSGTDQVAILSFSTEARVLSPFEDDKSLLEKSLANYSVTFARADLKRALESSNDLIKKVGTDECVFEVVSDFQLNNLERLHSWTRPAFQCAVNTYPISAPLEKNSFINGVAIHEQNGRLRLKSLEVDISHDGSRSINRDLDLDAMLANGDSGIKRADSGLISGAVNTESPDQFDADDSRYFVFRDDIKDAALVGDSGGSGIYWTAALNVAGASGETVKVKKANAGDSLSRFQLVILSLAKTISTQQVRDAVTYARNGGLLLIVMGRDFSLDVLRDAIGANVSDLPVAALARVDRERRLGPMDLTAEPLAQVEEPAVESLRNASVYHSFDLIPTEGSDVLARWSDAKPALVSKELGAGRILMLGTSVDRESSDLGIAPGFPSFVSSIYQEGSKNGATNVLEIGEPIFLGQSPDTKVEITSELGRRIATAGDLVRRSGDFIDRPGIYTLAFHREHRLIAFNVPLDESSTQLASPELVAAKLSQPTPKATNETAATVTDREWQSRIPLLAAVLLLAAELLLWIRRNNFPREATLAERSRE